MKGAEPIWIGKYEAFYFPRSGRVIVDVDGVRHEYESVEDAEDALEQLEWE